MNTTNYQNILDKTIEQIKEQETIPALLLHSCCAPCSSYVLEYLSNHFNITIFFYNPNISYKEEYEHRVEEQKRLIGSLDVKYPISFLEGNYDPDRFYQISEGLEDAPEGGERCFHCYELRLEEAAKVARDKGFDYFTTTLSVSPHKNATKLNKIGIEIRNLVAL